MCGLAGLLHLPADRSEEALSSQVEAMTRAIRHRGPDDSGVWADAGAGVSLGQRRLSIIDLSPGGHQPMVSHSGRYVISFNGEMYNFPDLRKELESAGVAFSSTSDTEVLLAAVEKYGLEQTLERMNGMFALALWDRDQRELWLARDRLGQKPLYLGWVGQSLVFASELKAIAALWKQEGQGSQPQLDRGAVSLYLRHGYVPEPHCIWAGFRKLMPGTCLRLNKKNLQPGTIPSGVPYWSAQEVAERGQNSSLPDTAETLDRLDTLLREATAGCMISDVPLGAFLSGGIDSSLVVAMMQAASTRKVRTFSIGFHETGYNEAPQAADVARHLGTDHTELYLSQQDAMDVIPRLPAMYDEPFADSSQIPAFLVSRMAREHVTVALSGDGGDELFGGYNRYMWGRRIERGMAALPWRLRRSLCTLARAVPVGCWDMLMGHAPGRFRYQHPGDKIHKLAGIMDAPGPEQAYWRLTSLWQNPEALMPGVQEPETALGNPALWPALGTLPEKMMALDTVTYLPGDILAKVDRASMAVGLEARVPLLDHRLVEFAWRLPLSMKIRDGQGKWALRQVLYRYVPRELIDRPKMGFGVPIDSWLRHDLKEWASDLLSEKRLNDSGLFDAAPIRKCWQEHLSGRRNWQHHLWTVLMFQAWAGQTGEAGVRDIP